MVSIEVQKCKAVVPWEERDKKIRHFWSSENKYLHHPKERILFMFMFEREKWQERRRPSTTWCYPQMDSMTGAGPRQDQEPEISSRSPMWGTSNCTIFSCFPRYIIRIRIWRCTNQSGADRDAGIPSGSLTQCTTAPPVKHLTAGFSVLLNWHAMSLMVWLNKFYSLYMFLHIDQKEILFAPLFIKHSYI